ncbi:hypothetical protein [Pseudomonas veronii]
MTRRNSAPKARFETIEILLLWEGRVSRSRLLDLFNIHETLANWDIAGVRAENPEAHERVIRPHSPYSNGIAVAHPSVLFESRGILRPKSWPNFGGKCI